MQLLKIKYDSIFFEFLIGLFVYSFFLSFSAPFSFAVGGSKNVILNFSVNFFISITYGASYSIPIFIVFYFLVITFYQINYFFIWGIIFGIITYLIVFTLHNISNNLLYEYKKYYDFFLVSAITGGVLGVIIKKHLIENKENPN